VLKKLGLLMMLLASSARAEPADERAIVLAGTEFSASNAYTHAGYIAPLAGNTLKQGWNVLAFASWLNYSYTTLQNGQPVKVRATVPGVRGGMGYQWTAGDVAVGLSASLGYQNTQQTPYIAATGKQGAAIILLPQVQLKYQFTEQTDADLMANYAIGQNSYWSHLRVGYQPRWDWRVGPELGLQAGQNYRIAKVGLFAATPVLGGAILELNTGVQANLNPPKEWYVGVALSKSL